MKFILVSLFLGLVWPLAAQNKQYTSPTDSDPEAKRLLDDIRLKYDAFETLTAAFRLEIVLSGQPQETQRGSMSRKGDLVRFKLGNQEGIINDEAAYIILHGSKEVQINNLPEPGEMTGVLTPQTLFSFYEGDDYIVALQGKETVGGRQLQVIELKPTDRDLSDFTKLRLLVDTKAKEVVSVKAFSRDSSQYTFVLEETEGDAALADGSFRFDPAQFPGYHVEDLRF